MGDRAGRVAPGDAYDDLADAVARGGLVGDGSLECEGQLRERYTVGLGSWESMLADLLGQLASDAGTRRRAMNRLQVPPDVRRAWSRGVVAGMDAGAAWLASQRRDSSPLALPASIRALRGDDYRDLAGAVDSLALVGDGALEPARLRPRYTIERAPWLRMVGDLLGQVVADAGSVERASTVLAVQLDRLIGWVRWFVSRGSGDAAGSRWPTASAGDDLDGGAYLDLVEAVERGAVAGDNGIEPLGVRERYVVSLDTWARMEADLLGQIVADAGSIRAAAKVLAVPRSTLAERARRLQSPR